MCCVNTSVSYINTLPVAQFVKCQILKISRNRTGGFRSSGAVGRCVLAVGDWRFGTTYVPYSMIKQSSSSLTIWQENGTDISPPQKKSLTDFQFLPGNILEDWRPHPHGGGSLKSPQIRPCHGFGDQQSVFHRGGPYSILIKYMWGL